jgi:enoyl-CoA hydratase
MSLLLRLKTQRCARLLITARSISTNKSYVNILVSRPESSVALFTLNRPKALNALNSALITELNEAMEAADKDAEIGALVLTGSAKAFAGTFTLHRSACMWVHRMSLS